MQEQAPARAAQEVSQVTRSASAADVYTAAKNSRQELRSQLESLEGKRSELVSELSDSETADAAKAGLTSRIKELDTRISVTDQAIAQADAAVVTAAAVPGAVVEPPRYRREGPPGEIFAIPIVFTIAVLMPIAIAYARRIWKRGATVIAPVPREVQEKLDMLSESVESIGLEVERIGEGQRFITKVFTETNARLLNQGPAQPIAVPQRGEHAAVPRAETA